MSVSKHNKQIVNIEYLTLNDNRSGNTSPIICYTFNVSEYDWIIWIIERSYEEINGNIAGLEMWLRKSLGF